MTAPAPRRRLFVSLGVSVTVPVVLMVVTVAIGVYLSLVRQSRLTLLSSKEQAADMAVKLTSVSIMPAVVFADDQEMQRAVANLARNADVSDVELWGLESSLMGAPPGRLAEFHRDGARALGPLASPESRHWRDADSIQLIEPVVNLEGKRVAALAVRFSTARESAALALLSRQILYVSAATALCLAFAILLAIHRVVVRPIKRLEEAASKLARGEHYDLERDHVRVEDEVVRLAEKFGEMAEAVRDRELKLGVRNAELKLILDSVDQGFLTARGDGTLFPERSAIVETWTGPLPQDASVWSLVDRIEPDAAGWAEAAWSQIAEDFLPLEVALEQLPRRLQRQGRHFSLAYHPVLLNSVLQRVVIVLTDITAEIERQRVLAEQHEFAVLIDQFVRDRRAFHASWTEASALVARIVEASEDAPERLLRDVHTLKGNARFFGLSRVSSLCHELESAMVERGGSGLKAAERAALSQLWNSLRDRIEPLMQGAPAFLEVSREDYERLLSAVSERKPLEHLAHLLRGLRRESVGARLERAKSMLYDASTRLGKTPPRVEIRHDDLRVPPEPWASFWSVLSHVLNNAADHGVENDDERRAAGKAVPATVWLSASMLKGDVVIEVRDDGRGIDWERVRQRAAERGVANRSRADLEQALFSDGFSLKDQVTETSGRGVGLAAVRNVVHEMGGRIELESTHYIGTTWRFRFPPATLDDSSSEDRKVSPLASVQEAHP